MNAELHSQKLDILARLIKADQLSLTEALLLLESDEVKEEIQTLPQNPWPQPIWSPPYWGHTGTGTSDTVIITTNPAKTSTGTMLFTSTTNSDTYTA